MVTLFQHIGRFLNNMDARAITSLIVTVLLLGLVVVMLVYGSSWLGIDENTINVIMARVQESPFALFGVIAVFCVLALTGFPQTLLIAGTVAVFGPGPGSFYSWLATMCSATLTFGLGHAFGARWVRKMSAGRAATMIEIVRQRGLLASMIVRWTPSAPFIVINAICGAAHIPLWKFWVGTGIGIIPKILFIALFTAQVDDIMNFFTSRNPADLAALGALVAVWIVFLLLVRWGYQRLKRSTLGGLSPDA